MNYKKDMLLILTAVFILGAAIQAARTDLVSVMSEPGWLSQKLKGYYIVYAEKQTGIIRNIETTRHAIHELYGNRGVQ